MKPKHPPAVALRLDGKPVESVVISPQARRLLSFLESLPQGELYTGSAVSLRTKIGLQQLSRHTSQHVSPEYTFIEGNKRIYGHPKSIAQYRSLRGIET